MKEEIKKICKEFNIEYDDNLSEEFFNRFETRLNFYYNWNYISISHELSEEFIEKFFNKMSWDHILVYQSLSENFIEKFEDKLDWVSISQNQKLSDGFIEKFSNKVSWCDISSFQQLSEEFIEKHANEVDWFYVSMNQKLSEEFIEKFADRVSWENIFKYQKLSEKFVEKYIDKADYFLVLKYQLPKKLSSHSRYHNWRYKDKEYKFNYIRDNTCYQIVDNKYVIAYKAVRKNYYSTHSFQYKYEIGGIYESNCDCNIDEENSFGLSAWTKRSALEYYDKGRLLKVKIMIEDIGAIVQNNKKIRCFKLEVIGEEDK